MLKFSVFILFGLGLLINDVDAQNIDYLNLIHLEKQSYAQKTNFKINNNPNDYDIVYHRVYWEVNPSELFIKGSVTSYFKALVNGFSVVHFDMIGELSADSVIYHDKKATITHEDDVLKIFLPTALTIGTLDSLTVYYHGVPQSASGFGSFETNVHGHTPVLWTLSEPYGAKEWWPCKQTLSDKIDSIDIFVKTPSLYKVGSNGKLMYEITTGTSKLTYWKHRYPIAPYLVAIAVTNYAAFSNFAKVNSENQEVEILNYVYPENKAGMEPLATYTVDALELYSSLLIPYPFYKEKYGHAQFGWGGGMEHQTMSFVNNFAPDLIAHELSHQWFGDYVTCSNWHDIWVNEGSAVFCESLCQEYLHPDNYLQWKKDRMNIVLSNAKNGSVYVDDTTNIDRIFDYTLTYQKGGLILHQLRNQIGDAPFFNGIKNLLKNAGFASATNVKEFLEAAADTNLTVYFNDWYYGQGYPEYQFAWNQEDNNLVTLTINQSTTNPSVSFFAMKIPVLLKGANSQSTMVFYNTQNNQTFTCNPGFQVTSLVFDPDYTIIAPHPASFILDIPNEVAEKTISIAPNPANNLLTIRASKNAHILGVKIIDASGKTLVFEKYPHQTKKNVIDISQIPVGLYYVKIETNQGRVTKKLAINR